MEKYGSGISIAAEKLNHEFTSASDTEVLLHGYTEWGKDLFEKLS